MTDDTTAATMPAKEDEHESTATPEVDASNESDNSTSKKKTSRRRGKRGSGRKKKATAEGETEGETEDTDATEVSDGSEEEPGSETKTKKKKKKKTSSRRKKTTAGGSDDSEQGDDEESSDEESTSDASSEGDEEADDSGKKKKKKSRSRRKSSKKSEDSSDDDEKTEDKAEAKPDRNRKKKSGRSKFRLPDRHAIEVTPVGPTCKPGARTMLVDDLSGEECRIAFIENGSLEEIFIERAATATSVGNIYKGRVINVEAAIQAAFVDFGHGQNGFLHVSDLHPRYFPGGDKTEKVGRKTPRRERPPIQDALKKGQEILVQVLKQGVGTKGPTLTSYLSIPGRLLVMMPGMDRVGVSRKVEDDDQRREMRRILDDLELPEGFGFILRTAGFERGKTELKRDAAYLQRLWKQMEKRMNSVGAPAELYTEGNLLVRSIRDMVDTSVGRIVTNGRKSFETAKSFLSVVAPRSAPPVYYFDGDTPLFERYGVEKQVDRIHSREVPLKSGGALVIDQTEALVAIDVNSGRSRSARDSETNAYQTNCEAVDEIARQLRLRDQGGLVICDLIDMRMERHRKDIENRLAENLRKDRARTTFLPISEFGIVEMTRQRMRPSMRSMHFSNCTACKGLGELRSADSIATDTIRHAASLLSHDKVRRVEIVCSPRTASSLLSSHRRRLEQLENSGKRIDVRISETIGIDSFDLYAYDDRNADLDTTRFPSSKPPADSELLTDLPEEEDAATSSTGGRKRRRRRKPEPADATSVALSGGFDIPDEPEDDETDAEHAEAGNADGNEETGEGGRKRRRRRRRRRGRGGKSNDDASNESDAPDNADATEAPDAGEHAAEATADSGDAQSIRIHILAKELDVSSKELLEICRTQLDLALKTHMSSIPGDAIERVRNIIAGTVPATVEEPSTGDSESESQTGEDDENAPRKKRRRRRRRRGRRKGTDEDGDSPEARDDDTDKSADSPESEAPADTSTNDPADEAPKANDTEPEPSPKPRRRGLYASQRRRVPPSSGERDDR